MERFPLCESCARRFFPKGRVHAAAVGEACFICQGSLSSLPSLLDSSLAQSRAFEWETFSIASSFPRSMLVREAEVATLFLPGEFTSIKNSVNAELSEKIRQATGKKNDQRAPDAAFEIDFSSGKAVCRPMQLYVYGHYLKLVRNFCQSRWHCSECAGRGCDSCSGSGMNYPSVEDEIGKVLKIAFGAKDCILHASGREDVDVRCLGNGRPFVAELSAPQKRSAGLRAIERAFEKNENVRAINLRFVGKSFIDSACNSHFDKEYEALVSADRPLSEADAKKISALSGTVLSQHTPTRVLARRTDMLRKRVVYKISAKTAPGGKLALRLLAEAGTYIKEFIHSDGGRTVPSVSSALDCKAQCDSLDVVAIHDYFLETVKS